MAYDANFSESATFNATFAGNAIDAVSNEVIDIRTAYDGTVYPSAGDAVRGQVSDLKEELITFTNDDAVSMEWEQGTILLDGTYHGRNTNSDYIVRTQGVLGAGTYIVQTNGQRLAGAVYNSNSSFSENTWESELNSRWAAMSTIEFTIPSGQYARLLVQKDGSTSMTPSEVAIVIKHKTAIHDNIEKIDTLSTASMSIPLDIAWEQGTILLDGTYKGTNSPSNYIIRSTGVLNAGEYLFKTNGQQIAIAGFTSDVSFSAATWSQEIGTRWTSGLVAVAIPENVYARILTRIDGETVLAPIDNQMQVYRYNITIINRNDIDQIQEEIEYLNDYPLSYDIISRMGMVDYGDVTDVTISNIKKSYRYGYRHIRFSLSFTSDSVPVMSHDKTVTINGTTYTIASTPYSTISSVILDFDSALLLAKRLGMKVDIELKFGISDSNLDIAYGIVAKYGMTNAVLWSSDRKQHLQYILAKQANASVGFIAHLSTTAIDNAVTLKNDCNYVRIDAFNTNVDGTATDDYSDEVLEYAGENGIPIKLGSAWTLVDLLYWLDKVSIVEVAYIRNPYDSIVKYYLES